MTAAPQPARRPDDHASKPPGAGLGPPMVEPAPGLPSHALAAELVVEGLLLTLSRSRADPQRREDRVRRALAALDAAPPTRPLRLRRVVRWSLAAAATLALVASISLLVTPERASAAGLVQRTVAALRAPMDRRFEARFIPFGADALPETPSAVVDTSDTGLALIVHRPPWTGHQPVFVGRDAAGAWAITADGRVERDNALAYWPPWSADDRTLAIDKLDEVLAELPASHALAHLAPERLADGGPLLERISARRTGAAPGHAPDTVELWIDPATRLPERIEFRWDADRALAPPSPAPTACEHRDTPPRHHDPDHHDRAPHSPGPRHGPKLLIFQRVQAPDLPDAWFSPEAHLQSD